MTQRKRDILKASVSWTDKVLTVNEEKAFQAGAEWADKTMLDKACEWIKANMPNYINFEEGFIYEVDMADAFKQAMEE